MLLRCCRMLTLFPIALGWFGLRPWYNAFSETFDFVEITDDKLDILERHSNSELPLGIYSCGINSIEGVNVIRPKACLQQVLGMLQHMAGR
jgi:hypothetical protein